MSHSILAGRGLSHGFGQGELRTTALDDVTLSLQRGEIALLMGPSGSGKTTLLAVLSGLLPPERGRVVALGQDLWQLSEHEREAFRLQHCGYIFQGGNLFPALTVRQHLEMVLCWGQELTRAEARPRIDHLLELLGLARRAHARPEELSGGEKQRVAIGRALIKDPAFCFADEPTSALDWEHGQQVMELMRCAAQDLGTTVLVVAHDPRLMPFADTVYHLEDGRLREPVAVDDTARYAP